MKGLNTLVIVAEMSREWSDLALSWLAFFFSLKKAAIVVYLLSDSCSMPCPISLALITSYGHRTSSMALLTVARFDLVLTRVTVNS